MQSPSRLSFGLLNICKIQFISVGVNESQHFNSLSIPSYMPDLICEIWKFKTVDVLEHFPKTEADIRSRIKFVNKILSIFDGYKLNNTYCLPFEIFFFEF